MSGEKRPARRRRAGKTPGSAPAGCLPLCASPTGDLEAASHGLRGLRMIGQDPLPQQLAILAVCEAAMAGAAPVPTVRRRVSVAAPEEGQLGLLPAPTTPGPAGSSRLVCIPAFRSVVVCAPRRAGKSSTLWALALGRCEEIAGYQVFVALQSGLKGRSRFLATARALELNDPDGPVSPANPRGRYRILRGAGSERIEWENGSCLFVVPPKPDAFRSEGAHLVILDEAQEHDVEASADLVAGALPLLDTEPAGQVIVAGTARADTRSGILWDYLAAARAAPDELGIIEYAAPEYADANSEAVWLAAHPGPSSGLTPLPVIAERAATMAPDRFRAEYLGQWGHDQVRSAVNLAAWADLIADDEESIRPPAGLVFAADCAPDGSRASIAAAWRLDDERVAIELVEHREGTGWVAKVMHDLAKTTPRSMLTWDPIGANDAALAPLGRIPAKPKTHPLRFDDIKAATAAFLQRVQAGTITHLDQPDLNNAVEAAALRQIGDSAVWGRKRSDGDITALVAASLATWVVGNQKPHTRRRVVSAHNSAPKHLRPVPTIG